jgi:lysophospholipase L1-like esterase
VGSLVTRWLARGILATTSVAIMFLVIDAALGVLYPQVPIIASDSRFGTLLRPNLSVRKAFGGHERVVTVITNTFGLRGPELPGAKPSGTRRILALGDSFTFGDAVQVDEAWPHQLEERLNTGGNRRYEVVNAGVGGYGTAHELLLSAALIPSVQPDLVVLGFSVVNDILDNLCIDEASYGPRRSAPCFTLDGDRLGLVEPAPTEAGRASRSWRLPGSRAADVLKGQVRRLMFWNPRILDVAQRLGMNLELPYMPATIASWYDERHSERGWALTRRLLLELRDRVTAQGLPLVILIVPASVQAEGADGAKKAILRSLGGEQRMVRAFLQDPTKPQALMARFCADALIECVDPLPLLLDAESRGQRAYYPVDQHWTPLGHGVAADAVATRLRRLGWMDTVPTARPDSARIASR